jgi:hypothetical protein
MPADRLTKAAKKLPLEDILSQLKASRKILLDKNEIMLYLSRVT